jgi:Protein of unknown function (DUF2752)
LEKNNSQLNKVLRWAGLTIWLALPVVLLILPANHFDNGQSICPSQLLLKKDCPGCGLTRSVQHSLHFDFIAAWNYNKLIIVVFPVLIMFYIHVAARFLGRDVFRFFRKFYW